MTDEAPHDRLASRLLLFIALAGVCLVLWTFVVGRPRPSFHGTTYTDTGPAEEFSLTDHDGRPVTLASYRGHPVLLFFGYTHCPDVCPMTLDRLSRAVRQVNADDARILLVTVDPARDTPAALKTYARRFGTGVVGLTGDSASLARARAGYGAYVETMPAAAPAHDGHAAHDTAMPAAAREKVVHSGVVYGIDRRGNLQVVITEGAPLDHVADDVRTLSRM